MESLSVDLIAFGSLSFLTTYVYNKYFKKLQPFSTSAGHQGYPLSLAQIMSPSFTMLTGDRTTHAKLSTIFKVN